MPIKGRNRSCKINGSVARNTLSYNRKVNPPFEQRGDKRIRPHLKLAGASYRIDETSIKVGKTCTYHYRAVDKADERVLGRHPRRSTEAGETR